jgi:hypothetical protein
MGKKMWGRRGFENPVLDVATMRIGQGNSPILRRKIWKEKKGRRIRNGATTAL